MQNPGICPALQGHFDGQRPAKSPASKCEITWAGLGMESKAPPFHGTAGQYWAKSMALKLRYVPAIPGPVVTKDWCIKLKYRRYAIKVSDRQVWANSAKPDQT